MTTGRCHLEGTSAHQLTVGRQKDRARARRRLGCRLRRRPARPPVAAGRKPAGPEMAAPWTPDSRTKVASLDVAQRNHQSVWQCWRQPGRSSPARGAASHSARARRRRQGPRCSRVAGRLSPPTDPTAMGRSRPAPPFLTPEGAKIDGHPMHGPRQAAREHGRTDAVPGFTHRRVRQSNDGEARQAVGNVNFDRDGTSNRAAQGC